MVERITISIDSEFADELRAMANQEGKSLSSLVREALEEWLITVRRKRAGEALLSLVKKRSLVDEEEALKTIEVMRREEW